MDDSKDVLFKVFFEGFNLGMQVGERNGVINDLSGSEIAQRCRNRFDNLMEEMNS